LSLQLFASALQSLARAQEHSLSLGRRSAVEKVALFLMGRAECAPTSEDILLAMTRKDIADYLGLSIETVSRTFTELEDKSFIKLIGARRVRLENAAALRELCA
jgi:CRP-like cAMP-binding protein